jgi:hypothetical protein
VSIFTTICRYGEVETQVSHKDPCDSSILSTGTRGKDKTVSHETHNLGIWQIRALLPLPLMKQMLRNMGSPYFLRAFHGWSTIFWVPFTVLAFFLGWLQSVTFVSLVSMVALFLGSFSSWQASRTEVAQDELSETKADKKRKLFKSHPSHGISRQLRLKRRARL